MPPTANQASTSLSFRGASDEVNKLVNDIQQLGSAVRGVMQEFTGLLGATDMAGSRMQAQAPVYQNKVGEQMGEAMGLHLIRNDAVEAFAAAKGDSIRNRQSVMFAHGVPDTSAIPGMTDQQSNDFILNHGVWQKNEFERVQRKQRLNVPPQSSSPVEDSSPGRKSFYFGDALERRRAEADAVVYNDPSRAFGVSDFYREKYKDRSGLFQQAESVMATAATRGETGFVTEISNATMAIKALAEELKNAQLSDQRKAEITSKLAHTEEELTSSIEKANSTIGAGGAGGGGGGWSQGLGFRGAMTIGAAALGGGFQVASQIQGIRSQTEYERFGAAREAMLTNSSIQGATENRLLRGMDMRNAQSQLEFFGDLLLGDTRLGATGRVGAMTRATNDTLTLLRTGELETSSMRAGAGAKAVGAASLIGIGAGLSDTGVGAVIGVPMIAGGAALGTSAVGELAQANRNLYGQLAYGGNRTGEAADEIRARATAQVGQYYSNYLDDIRTVAGNNVIAGGALTRMQAMGEQYRSGFATAGRYNPMEYGAYAVNNPRLQNMSANLGMSPEDLQAVQIGLAANAPARVGASAEDAARIVSLSKSGVGDISQLMNNVAGLGAAQSTGNDLKSLIPVLESAFSSGFDKSRLAQQFVGAALQLTSNLGGGATGAAQMLATTSQAFGGGEYGLRKAMSGLEALQQGTAPLKTPLSWGSIVSKTIMEHGLMGTRAGNVMLHMDMLQVSQAASEFREWVDKGASQSTVSEIENQGARDLAINSLVLNNAKQTRANARKALSTVEDVVSAENQFRNVALNVGARDTTKALADLSRQRQAILNNSALTAEGRQAQLSQLDQMVGSIGGASGIGLSLGQGGGAAAASFDLPTKSRFDDSNNLQKAEGRAVSNINPAAQGLYRSLNEAYGGTTAKATSPIFGNEAAISLLNERFKDQNYRLNISQGENQQAMQITAAEWTAYQSGKGGAAARRVESALKHGTVSDVISSNADLQSQVGAASGGTSAAGKIDNFLGCPDVSTFANRFFDAWKAKEGHPITHVPTGQVANPNKGTKDETSYHNPKA
jgi:hypothetical protein